MKQLFFLFFLSFIFMASCSQTENETQQDMDKEPEPVQQEEIQSLNIQEYFPNHPGTIREYNYFNKKGSLWKGEYEVINFNGSAKYLSPDELDEFVVVKSTEIYEPETSVKESSDLYEIKDNQLIRSPQISSLLETEEEAEVLLSSELSWKMAPGVTRTITGTGKEIETEAGSFSDCIEVTDTFEDKESYIEKSYFAPGRGLVLTKFQTEGAGSFSVQKELINFQLPDVQGDTDSGKEEPDTEPSGENGKKQQPSETQPNGSFLYHNEKFDFYLDIPTEWKGHYLIEETEEEGETTINFRFTAGENLYIDTIFYLVISDKTKEQIKQENAESGFPLTYLTSHNGKSFSYLYNVGDPSLELIHAENDLNKLIELKQQVPEMMETLRFHP